MPEGRVVQVTRMIGLADVRPDATARLDALAGSAGRGRRRRVDGADPGHGHLDLAPPCAARRAHTALSGRSDARTWCSGVGPRWAERRTQLHVADVLCVEATALWVHTDPATGAPTPLPAAFDAIWGAGAPKVSARLRHGAPPWDAARSAWALRATDFDVVGHVNNAAYWAAAEEELARRGRPRVEHAEIEFRAGLDEGDPVEQHVADTADGFASWLCVDGDVRASMLIGCRP